MSARLPVSHSKIQDLVEDAENLVGIDGAHGQIVVRIAAVVEMEAAQHVRGPAATPQSVRYSAPGNDARYPPAPWPAARRTRRAAAPCPNRRCRCDRTPARRACTPPACAGCGQAARGSPAGLLRTIACGGGCSACPDSSSRRRTTAKDRGCPGACRSRRCPAMWSSAAWRIAGVGIAERSVLVNLVLKHVGVDGAGAHAVRGGQRPHFSHVANAVRQIPKHVQRDRRAHAGPAVHLARIAELLLDGVAAAACRNLPKRVPVLANPQEGSSI